MFRDGQWLALVGPDNRPVGSGIYEAEGAIAVRVLERSARRPDAAWVDERVAAALARRAPLADETDGFRAVHGESDGLPAVVVDVYGDTAVLMTYSAGAEAMGRVAAAHVRRRLGLRRVLWKPAHRGAARSCRDRAARAVRRRPRRAAARARGRARSTGSTSPADRRAARTSTCAGCAAGSRSRSWAAGACSTCSRTPDGSGWPPSAPAPSSCATSTRRRRRSTSRPAIPAPRVPPGVGPNGLPAGPRRGRAPALRRRRCVRVAAGAGARPGRAVRPRHRRSAADDEPHDPGRARCCPPIAGCTAPPLPWWRRAGGWPPAAAPRG